MKHIVYSFLIVAMVFTLASCGVKRETPTQLTETEGNSTAATEVNSTEAYTMPEYYTSLNEISTAIKNNDFSEKQNLKGLDYVYTLSDSINKLPISEISVNFGSAAVFYSINNPDVSLIEKNKESKDMVKLLSYIKVITFRNVIIKDGKIRLVEENRELFTEHSIDGKIYYVGEIKSNGILVCWEIVWAQDEAMVCVGIPVSYGLEKALKYCNCSKYYFNK